MDCFMHEGRPATQDLVDPERRGDRPWKFKQLPVCDECFERYTNINPACKHCGIRVVSAEDTRAKNPNDGHPADCPRSTEYEGDNDGDQAAG